MKKVLISLSAICFLSSAGMAVAENQMAICVNLGYEADETAHLGFEVNVDAIFHANPHCAKTLAHVCDARNPHHLVQGAFDKICAAKQDPATRNSQLFASLRES